MTGGVPIAEGRVPGPVSQEPGTSTAKTATSPTAAGFELLMRERASPYDYLRTEILPQLAPPPYGDIEMERLSQDKPVYLFTEKATRVEVVGKLFERDSVPLEEAWSSAEKEYSNLGLLRNGYAMSSGDCYVVAALGTSRELCALLVTERAPGRVLDYYIAKAIRERKPGPLLEKLAALAGFFAKLHRNCETDCQVSPALPQSYLDKLLGSLDRGVLSDSDRCAVEEYARRWWGCERAFATDVEVLVHGDATPTNFLFHGQAVIGIDLERMKRADRCWDLGFMAAELKHHFMWRMGDAWAAEPFISHFLSEYARHFGGSRFFRSVTCKIPLYMALGLLRIARNAWLDGAYRQVLAREARSCLQYGL